MSGKINSICVYAASSTKLNPIYTEAAQKLGLVMAQNNIKLINGAGGIGLMKETADAALSVGGKVTGVIPKFMIDQKWHHTGLTELVVVDNMHERKALMAKMSDAIIALPGGCGTLEELLEIITWKQLGLYFNPIIVLNTNDFYSPLIEMLNKAIQENFMSAKHGEIWKIAESPEQAVALAINTPKWDSSIRQFAKI